MKPLIPTKVHLHKQAKTLEVAFGNTTGHLPHSGQANPGYILAAEYLRVHSPSAEVRGHGPGQEVTVEGKIDVAITTVKPSGNYGLQIIFDDGHDSGIFSWEYLYELGEQQKTRWEDYLNKLKNEGKSRDPHTVVLQFPPITPTTNGKD